MLMPLLASLTIAALGTMLHAEPTHWTPSVQDPQPKLAAAEQKSLQAKLSKFMEAQIAYDDPSVVGKAREKAQKTYDQSKEAFLTEWKRQSEKHGDLLKSVPDLEVIFANGIPYDRKAGLSLRKVDAKDGIPAHWLSVPKSYKAETSIRALLLVPGLDEKNEWVDGKKWFDTTWTDKSPLVGDTILHIPVVAKEVELDSMPDYSKTEAEGQERQRIEVLIQSFGDTQRSYNVDRSKRFLDAGKGATGFAMRLASHFPDLFSGVILRHPIPVDELRLGSLGGTSFLLLSSAETAAACSALKERLDKVDGASCTILTTTDAYPYLAAAAEIEKWMATPKRVVNRKKIIIEPNDDRFRKAYWVAIEKMVSVHTAPEGMKPRVEIESDREQNRIKVTCTGVESVILSLNDAIVDLDKPVTIVVNDKAITEKRGRDFTSMLRRMLQKYDTQFLFPVEFRVNVPQPENKSAATGAGK